VLLRLLVVLLRPLVLPLVLSLPLSLPHDLPAVTAASPAQAMPLLFCWDASVNALSSPCTAVAAGIV
jgi:hypothetical protein